MITKTGHGSRPGNGLLPFFLRILLKNVTTTEIYDILKLTYRFSHCFFLFFGRFT